MPKLYSIPNKFSFLQVFEICLINELLVYLLNHEKKCIFETYQRLSRENSYLLLKYFFIVQTRAVQYVITSGRPKIPV